MKLDKELLRQILSTLSSNQKYTVSTKELQVAIPDASENDIAQHLSLAFDEGLVGFIITDHTTFSPWEFNLDEISDVSITLQGYAYEQLLSPTVVEIVDNNEKEGK